MAEWTRAKIRHLTYAGQLITIKVSNEGTDVLIAPGHIDDIPPGGADHVHLWGLRNGDFRMHDLRSHPALFPNLRSEFRPPAELDAKQSDMVTKARLLAAGTIDKQSFEAAKALQAEWKASGKASPANTHAFKAAIDEYFAKRKVEMDKRNVEWEKRKSDWASNKTAKERVVNQAESLASTTELKGSGPKMKALFEEFKNIGPTEKTDNEKLWDRFRNAQTKLRQRNDEVFAKRKIEWAANKGTKETLVSRMRLLSNTYDTRGLGDQAKALQAEWKTVGHFDRTEEDHLWNAFRAAADTVFQKVKAANAERAWAHVQETEMKLRDAESKVYAAQARYSEALNAQTPPFTHPHCSSILARQNKRQADTREWLIQAEQWRDKVLGWVVEARSRANRM